MAQVTYSILSLQSCFYIFSPLLICTIHQTKIVLFRSTIEIDPKSSFYQHTQHHLELNYDGQEPSEYNGKGTAE